MLEKKMFSLIDFLGIIIYVTETKKKKKKLLSY